MKRRSTRKPLPDKTMNESPGVQDSDDDEYHDAVMQVDTPDKSSTRLSTRAARRSNALETVSSSKDASIASSPQSPASQSRNLDTTPVVKHKKSTKLSTIKKHKIHVIEEEEPYKSPKIPDELFKYDEQVTQLTSLLKSSMEGIESNSVLICGPHGSGKSALLEKCLEDAKLTTGLPVEVVYLSGYLDTDPVNLFKSVRDTTGAEEPSISLLLRELLEKSKSEQKALFFILDAFDKFCRKNQTFLYNIFDMSQKCTNVAVVGMTSRLDCLELLEKRVKSRMSQTVIHLNSPFASVDEYVEYAKSFNLIHFPDKKSKKKYFDTVTKTAASQFGFNTSIGHMKRFLIQTACDVLVSATDKEDPIITAVTSLSHLELLILVMAFKYCKVRNIDTLPCNSLVTESAKFSGRTKISRQVVYQLIQNLLACGLFVKTTHSKTSCNFINDWSMLAVNIREEDLRTALNKLQSTLPASLHAEVNLN